MELSFVKTTVYQQKLDSDNLGEEEVHVSEQTTEEQRPEWKLLRDPNFRSLHDQLKDNEALKEGIFGNHQPIEASADDDDSKAEFYYGSELVDCPESRREERQEIAAFQAEQRRLLTEEKPLEEEEEVHTKEDSPKTKISEGEATATGKRLSFFAGCSGVAKKSKVSNFLEGYDADSD
eukprot:Protomagalhaensia_sp_Gyna_25__5165@NODE_60_length_5841_cov_193_739573_g44_i0_p3_GENE_NODE_60_length_5841_cov_193_739573_g44_i0NODE_60_length_5841_cov_193_739573_g44_i0_p3_ORF_typecomplete_len178_score39_55_NODE_60_length_5841_cov_193_739573_g44_i048735406